MGSWLQNGRESKQVLYGMFVSLVYCAESTVRWFVVREKHCWMTADSADKSKRTGSTSLALTSWCLVGIGPLF
jgi:hypothetical protein